MQSISHLKIHLLWGGVGSRRSSPLSAIFWPPIKNEESGRLSPPALRVLRFDRSLSIGYWILFTKYWKLRVLSTTFATTSIGVYCRIT